MITVAVSLILLLFLACFGFYWDSREKDWTTSTGSTFVMDTFVDQKFSGKQSGLAVEKINELLKNFENRFSAYVSSSEISRINQNAGLSYIQVSEETFDFLKTAKEYCKRSQGLFDITIGPLVDLWDITGENPRVPDEREIQSVLKRVNYEDLLLREEDHSVMLRQEGQKLNLGGMAKGTAGVLAIETAKSYGVHSGYLSVGGNIFTIGRKEDGSAYRFGVRDPRGAASDYIGIVELTDTTMATSGDYERYFEEDGVRYHHILNPDTGYPGNSDLISVSVICPDGGMADFLSTTLFLAGKEAAMAYAQSDFFDFILVDRKNNVYLSDGILPYFTPNEQAEGYHFVNVS